MMFVVNVHVSYNWIKKYLQASIDKRQNIAKKKTANIVNFIFICLELDIC